MSNVTDDLLKVYVQKYAQESVLTKHLEASSTLNFPAIPSPTVPTNQIVRVPASHQAIGQITSWHPVTSNPAQRIKEILGRKLVGFESVRPVGRPVRPFDLPPRRCSSRRAHVQWKARQMKRRTKKVSYIAPSDVQSAFGEEVKARIINDFLEKSKSLFPSYDPTVPFEVTQTIIRDEASEP